MDSHPNTSSGKGDDDTVFPDDPFSDISEPITVQDMISPMALSNTFSQVCNIHILNFYLLHSDIILDI